MSKDKGYMIHMLDPKKPKKTTHGRKTKVELQDGTTTWMDIKSVREADPIELAKYGLSNKVDNKPAFCRWGPYCLNKRKHVMSKM